MKDQITSGELAGAVFVGGVPFPTLAQLDAEGALDTISLSPEQIAAIIKQIPEITPSVIPAHTYPSLTQDYHTIGLYNFAVGSKDLPDDLVYELVKAVFENHDDLVKAHPSAVETIPANVSRNTVLPFHPGALRYYREKGIKIPDQLAADH